MTDGEAKCSAEVAEGSRYMAGVMAITGLIAAVLFLSGLFHSGLRRLGQPSIISHILAGVVIGPTVLGRLVDLRQLGMADAGRALSNAIQYALIIFMFFVGLEIDLRYVRHNLRSNLVLAAGGSSICLLLTTLFGPFFYGFLHPQHGQSSYPETVYASTALFMLVVTSTASPVLIRVVTELKLTGTETGQLAIGAAFANDMASLLTISVIVVNPTTYDRDGKPTPPPHRYASAQVCKVIMLAWLALNVWVSMNVVVWTARALNRIKRGRQYISVYELCAVLLLIIALSQHVQVLIGYSAAMTAFLMGLATPREGPTARTLFDRLTYPVHRLKMPLCFGVIGARLDFAMIGHFTVQQVAVVVVFSTVVSTAGRVAGTVLAGRMLGLPAQETVVLGLLLNVKGYVDILAINFADKVGIWDEPTQAVLVLSSIINILMAGPTSAAIVRQQRRSFLFRSHRLQDVKVDQELRVLVCVHGAGSVPAMLTLAELSSGTTPTVVYLLHLVELMSARKYAITHLYHHTDAHAGGADDDPWGYTREIDRVVAAVNAFTNESAVPVRLMKAVSSLVSMDADVRNGVEDARASLVVVPFHKEQRYDGRMVCRREGRRLLNKRILRRTPCTVGILVERSLPGGVAEKPQPEEIDQMSADGTLHNVAVVFLGGPDDREAVAYATRLAAHPSVSVMVSRFFPPPRGNTSRKSGAQPLASSAALRGGVTTTVAVGKEEEEAMEDEEFMADFYARFVAPGHVSYMEMYVSDGVEMVDLLSSMVGMYSLFVVGKGGGGTPWKEITRGMGGFGEDCLLLGPIGEFLSSDDLAGCCASVLVLQQHSLHRKIRRLKHPHSPPTSPCKQV